MKNIHKNSLHFIIVALLFVASAVASKVELFSPNYWVNLFIGFVIYILFVIVFFLYFHMGKSEDHDEKIKEKKEANQEREISEIKEMLTLLINANYPIEKSYETDWIKKLSDEELYFFLINMFFPIRWGSPQSHFNTLTGKVELWDEFNNYFEKYFEYIKDGHSHWRPLREGIPRLLLDTIKTDDRLAHLLISFFEKILVGESTRIDSVGADKLSVAQTFITNLKLFPEGATSVIDKLIKKADSHEHRHTSHALIIDNMAVAITENIDAVDPPTIAFLEKFLSTKNTYLRYSLADRLIELFEKLPETLKRSIFSLSDVSANPHDISEHHQFECAIKSHVIVGLLEKYESLSMNYREALDNKINEIVNKEEHIIVKCNLASFLLKQKSNYKYFKLLDELLTDEVTINVSSLGHVSTEGRNILLNKIKSLQDDKTKINIYVDNYFFIPNEEKELVHSYIKKHSNEFLAQKFANMIGSSIDHKSDNYLELIDIFRSLSETKSESIKVGVLIAIGDNGHRIPKKVSEDILRVYSKENSFKVHEHIVRDVCERWVNFSPEIHELSLELAKGLPDRYKREIKHYMSFCERDMEENIRNEFIALIS